MPKKQADTAVLTLSEAKRYTRATSGKRLRIAKAMTNLSIEQLIRGYEKEYNTERFIHPGTWRGWESGQQGTLTLKGADKVCEILKHAGVNCSPEWLIYGVGNPPKLID